MEVLKRICKKVVERTHERVEDYREKRDNVSMNRLKKYSTHSDDRDDYTFGASKRCHWINFEKPLYSFARHIVRNVFADDSSLFEYGPALREPSRMAAGW